MIFNYSIEVLNNIFMVQILNEIDFLFYRFDLFLTDGHFLHGYYDTVIKINSLID